MGTTADELFVKCDRTTMIMGTTLTTAFEFCLIGVGPVKPAEALFPYLAKKFSRPEQA